MTETSQIAAHKLQERIEGLQRELETERARNQPLRNMIKSQEEALSVASEKYNEYRAALATLDSERAANEKLTTELAELHIRYDAQREVNAELSKQLAAKDAELERVKFAAKQVADTIREQSKYTVAQVIFAGLNLEKALAQQQAAPVAEPDLLERVVRSASGVGIYSALDLIDRLSKQPSPVAEPPVWSGWAVQYGDDSLPKLFGSREIAELNWYPGESKLLHLVAQQEKGHD
jgi:hypothetical protein